MRYITPARPTTWLRAGTSVAMASATFFSDRCNICVYEEIARCDTLLSPIGRPTSPRAFFHFPLALSSLSPPPMLGPRTRSAARRAPRAEHPEVQHNGNGNDDEREPKRIKRGERTQKQAPASEQPEALAAANLYDSMKFLLTFAQFSDIFLVLHDVILYFEGYVHFTLAHVLFRHQNC